MDRRRFLTGTGGLALATTSCGRGMSDAGAATNPSPTAHPIQSNDGVVIHPWESDMMRGFPPPPEKLVTRENIEESEGKLRWAAQHYRELFPTQRVTRGDCPLILLSRNHRDIMGLGFQDTAGQSTTLAQQLQDLSVDAFIVLHRGKIICEEYSHGIGHIIFPVAFATLLGGE